MSHVCYSASSYCERPQNNTNTKHGRQSRRKQSRKQRMPNRGSHIDVETRLACLLARRTGPSPSQEEETHHRATTTVDVMFVRPFGTKVLEVPWDASESSPPCIIGISNSSAICTRSAMCRVDGPTGATWRLEPNGLRIFMNFHAGIREATRVALG